MKSPKTKVKIDQSVEVNPRRVDHKSEQIKFHFKKEAKIVNIDKSLKRIYSITN